MGSLRSDIVFYTQHIPQGNGEPSAPWRGRNGRVGYFLRNKTRGNLRFLKIQTGSQSENQVAEFN